MKIASCHPERKQQAKGLCKNCYDKHLKSSNANYRRSQVSNTTIWAKNNPEKIKIIQKRRKEKDIKDPNFKMHRRNAHLMRKYGITHADYDIMFQQQNKSCAICFRQPKPGKYLHVDHCHESKRIRGLLCHQCNWYLGTIDADPLIQVRLACYRTMNRGAYIEEFEATRPEFDDRYKTGSDAPVQHDK